MALFGRKQPGVDTVPQEVREYYQSERRERAGVAWLLALGTLVVTLLLASGIFFGGRWAYRTLTNGGDKRESSQQAQNQDQGQKNDNKGKDTKNQGTGTSSTNTSTPSSNTGAGSPGGSPAGTTNPTPQQQPAAQQPAPGSTASPQGGSTPAALTNTGPGDVFAIFVVAVAFGAGAHHVVTARRIAR